MGKNRILALVAHSIFFCLVSTSCSSTSNMTYKRMETGWSVSASTVDLREAQAVSLLGEAKWWAVKGGWVYYSASSGNSWEPIYRLPKTDVLKFGVPSTTDKIQFIDEQNGWLLSTKLMATHDGGKSWRETVIHSNNRANEVSVYRSFYFIDKDHGWVVGNKLEASGMRAAALWETLDAGQKWTEVKCKQCDEGEVFWDVAADKGGHAWILGNLIYYKDLNSYDIRGVAIDLAGVSSSLASISTTGHNTIWAEAADGGSYVVSHDQGKSWLVVTLDKSSNKVLFVDDEHAYRVSNGSILSSRDGGRNWLSEIRDDYLELYADSQRKIVVAFGSKIAVKKLN